MTRYHTPPSWPALITTHPLPHQFLQSLQRHVLALRSTADQALERERTEVTVERDAFEAFVERLATINPETEPALRGVHRAR